MKGISIALSAICGFLLSIPLAHAGATFYWPVEVNTVDRLAYGTMIGARSSSDTIQRIGCAVKYGYPSSSYPYPGAGQLYVSCSAASTTASLYCISYDPAIIDIARTITSTSAIGFGSDKNGVCTKIFVDNDSSHTP